MRRQGTDGRKHLQMTYLMKHCFAKWTESSLKLNNKKAYNLITEWAKDLNTFLIKEDTQMAMSSGKCKLKL